MKRKLFTLIMMLVLTMTMMACGKENENPNTELGSINENMEDPETNVETESNVSTVTPSDKTETPKDEKPVISTVKESEAVVNFDGIKVPMSATWNEFKQIMADNNWTFEDDEDDFPNEKNLSGKGFINTNCGKVYFKFSENEDKTQSVLMTITVYSAYSPSTINIVGINTETSIEELSKVLTTVDGRNDKFYLDDYLTVTIAEDSFSVNRTYFHMR